MLRNAGLRATTPRIAVLRCLRHSDRPLSHGDACEALEDHGFDRATVYRNLTDLTEVGVLRRADLGDHVWRFELVREQDHDGSAHPHFICNECGTVSCVPELSVTVDKTLALPKALAERNYEVQLRGVCDSCS